MKRSTRIGRWVLAAFGLGIVLAQVVQPSRTNPPVAGEIAAPAEVHAILRRACYDCHSNETVWPWYSRVAPVSWLVARDVNEGRRHLNFSAWNQRTPERQAKGIQRSWREVERGDMPLWFYLPLHSQARLSDGDREILRRWADSAAAK